MAIIRYQMRVPEELIDEARELVAPMNEDRQLALRGKVTIGDVMRLALVEGLNALKQRYPRQGGTK
jgi:hypothetical protein